MSDDIVARLRLYANASIDGGWASVFRADLNIAADEIDAAIKQSEDTRRWLRDACAEIARIETRFYDALTPQQIAERNGWDCFKENTDGR